MKERQNCWIRGHMDEKDYHDDTVRLATIRCPYRKGQVRYFFGTTGQMDYDCTHPGFASEHQEIQHIPGGVMAGGIDGYATFCSPVDMHLTSLGEPSRLIIEGKCQIIYEKRMLPPGD